MASRARSIGKSVHSPEQVAFCELMVKARKAAKLTQHQLAKRLKKPQSFVAKYEGGERRKVRRIAPPCRHQHLDTRPVAQPGSNRLAKPSKALRKTNRWDTR